MDKLPHYINCKTNGVACDYLMHKKLCKNKCPYAREVLGLGVGAADIGLAKKLNMDEDQNPGIE